MMNSFPLKYIKLFLFFVFIGVTSRVYAGHPLWERPEILEIFRYFPSQTNPVAPNDSSASLESLNTFAQNNFLRPRGQERTSPATIEHYGRLTSHLSQQQQDKLISLFTSLEMINAVYPSAKNPNYIFIHGSTLPSMRDRIMFVANLVTDGYLHSTPEIIFLSGERPLFESETEDNLKNPAPYPVNPEWVVPAVLPKNESQLGLFLWQQLKLPHQMRFLTVHFVNASKIEGTNRATTEDAVKQLLDEIKHLSGYCWVVSSNPFISYQEKVTKKIMKDVKAEGITLEGIGPKAPLDFYPRPIAIGILLDNLARTLYTENELSK